MSGSGKIQQRMTTQVYTIKEVLDYLNKDLASKPWEDMGGVFSLPQATIDHNNKTVNQSGSSLVLKGFINKETGEIRTYLSKLLDEPETKDLS